MFSLMKFQLPLFAVLLVAPGALFAQAPAAPAPTAPPAAAGSKPEPELNATLPAEIDPVVIAVLRQAFAAQRTKGSFRATMESAGQGGGAIPSMEMEFVFPDRMRMKMSGMEIVGVGGKTMMRMGDSWMPAPAEVSKASGSFGDPKKVEEMLGNTTYAKSLGQTKIDEKLLDSYEVHVKTKGAISKLKFYISPGDSLIRRVETQADLLGKPTTSTLNYSDYGVPIRIELPK